MDDVELVGVHDDGEHLVLAGPDGGRYLLAIDEPLRAAVRRDRARLGQLQIAIDGSLRPKEIQRRIRGGMSAQELAEASGLPLEHVLRYEGPVMAEREHVAQRARGTAVQRTGSTAVSLEALVSQRLGARGVAGEREWDAWREDTGSWVVQVSFTAGGRARAGQWRFDPGAAHLEPMDDEARWLTARTEQEGPLGGGARRLSAVKVQEKVYDVEADGGVRPSTRESAPRDRTVDLLDALRGRRGKRQPVHDGEGEPEQGDLVDELLEGADAPPPAAHPPASRPDEATDAEILALPEPPRCPTSPSRSPAPTRSTSPTTAHPGPTTARPRSPGARPAPAASSAARASPAGTTSSSGPRRTDGSSTRVCHASRAGGRLRSSSGVGQDGRPWQSWSSSPGRWTAASRPWRSRWTTTTPPRAAGA